MRLLIWSLTALLIAAWSFVSWLAHLVIQAGGGLLASNADLVPADPLIVEWVSWLATIGTGVGGWLIFGERLGALAWAGVVVTMAGVALVLKSGRRNP